jgi:hypothetical protein
VLCFVLALMSKPMAVTLPCALLLFDVWPLGRLRTLRDLGKLVQEKLLLFLLVVASSFMTFYAQTYGGAVRNDLDLETRLVNIVSAYMTYLGQTVWPTNLVVLYPLSMQPPPMWLTVVSALVLVGITGLGVVLCRSAPYLLFGWLWFLGTLVPVIGLVHVGEQAHADRYTYLPHIGLFVAVVWGAADLAGRLRIPVSARGVAVVAVAVILAITAREQLSYWRDSLALWEHAVAVNPDNTAARITLGKAHLGRGDWETGLKYFEEVLRDDPLNVEAYRVSEIIKRKLGRRQ